jgi:hypothetical protein
MSLLAYAFSLLAAGPSCLTNYGKTACGYSCLAAHGAVSCASTPAGICTATSDASNPPGVVCWDPPEWVRAHYGDKVPPPQCLARTGKVACGYHCVAHGGEVSCAASPDGICRASSLGITCWDPPVSTYCADSRALPRPQCILSGGEIACGYACEARGGRMACASTPGGKCVVLPGQILCTDPPAPAMCGFRPCVPETAGSERSWCRPAPADEDRPR